jgi:uncharacterized protein YdhG (YjbR/CyaY superfamily)
MDDIERVLSGKAGAIAETDTEAEKAAVATRWIDAYLAPLPADKRAALQSLRETIASAAPQAVETVSYGMPAFRYRGKPLIWYLAAKTHCSLFPGEAGVIAHREELTGFDASGGTVRFRPDRPLPADLVVKLVRMRMAQLDAKASPKQS